MSRKGQKGKARKKAAAAQSTRPVAQATAAPAATQGDPERLEMAQPATASPDPAPISVDEPAAPVSRPQLETPVAFAAPRASSAAGLASDAVASAASAGGDAVSDASDASAEADDRSVPPVDLDNPFFATAPAVYDEHEPLEDRDPLQALKRHPATARRRAHLARYVTMAVGAASVLCIAALVKAAVVRGPESGAASRASQPAVAAAVVATPEPVSPSPATATPSPSPPPEPAAVAAPQAAPPAAEVAVVPAAAATEPAAPAPGAEAPVAADVTATATPDPKAAAVEKRASQAALERGKLDDAIAAGQRSVALDPTDAEAWLILGAAYQEKGDRAAARRAFRSCLDQGKRGPRGECGQML